MLPVALYDYLAKARARLFDWVRALSSEQYAQEFPHGLKTVQATLTHIASAEWAYGRRLRLEPVTAGESPFQAAKMPAFADLEKAWTAMAGETRALLAEIADWDAPLEYRVFPQGPGGPALRIRTDKLGVALQMATHEIHHRAQVLAMLRQLGVPAQNLDYSAMMFEREEEPA